MIARLHLLGATPLFSFSSTQDYTDATMMIAQVDQDGFALPDRDYYLTNEFKDERPDYLAHLARMFGLLGHDKNKAKSEAEAVMRIETGLAKAATGIVERREPKNVHHKMTLPEFIKLTPTFDWTAYFVGVGAPAFTLLDVADLRFFKGLEASLKSVPLTQWKAYLRWTLIHSLILSAPKAFVDEDFVFFDKRLGGQTKLKARWKRCVDATDEQLGHALGEAYIAREFSPAAKQRVFAMTRQIEKAMEANIKALDWMSHKTKARALEKLAGLVFKIGHPDKWLDYSTLEIIRRDALGNRERASAFRAAPPAFQNRQARRPPRVGHDAADQRRLLRSADERHRSPRRYPPAAELRPEGRQCSELRKSRHPHRPRTDARLRRRGAPLRRARQLAGLVDEGRCEDV